MNPKSIILSKFSSKHAPIRFGAFLCGGIVSLLFLTSCQEAEPTVPKKFQSAQITKKAKKDIQASTTAAKVESTDSSKDTFSFAAYNVRNWLTSERFYKGERKTRPKPEKEKVAVVDLLATHAPDVIGISEIGTKDDLLDLQTRLKAAGLDLPHSEHTHGADQVRHLALLSRYPIIQTNSQTDLTYKLSGETWTIRRGILDATVSTPIGNVRCLGIHFKSKREIPEADQAEIRHNEARLLRAHVDQILADDPEAKILVYGDFNDTKQSPAIRTVKGVYRSPTGLTYIQAYDKQGTSWTHHWAREDVYSRFDWVMLSKALLPYSLRKEARILEHEDDMLASDHRAVFVPFKKKD